MPASSVVPFKPAVEKVDAVALACKLAVARTEARALVANYVHALDQPDTRNQIVDLLIVRFLGRAASLPAATTTDLLDSYYSLIPEDGERKAVGQ